MLPSTSNDLYWLQFSAHTMEVAFYSTEDSVFLLLFAQVELCLADCEIRSLHEMRRAWNEQI